tara:strand:- start:141 stop:527 length:387 start_codon:yes stop_codon:yes gene_type:complete
MKTPARQQYEAALKGAKKGRGRFPVGPKEDRTLDGHVFASVREMKRYAVLRDWQRLGVITHLELQPKFPVTINGHPLTKYTADFAYFENGERVVEDCKSSGTAKDTAYRLRKKAAELQFFIKIREVGK